MKECLFSLIILLIIASCSQKKEQNISDTAIATDAMEMESDERFRTSTFNHILAQLNIKYEDCYLEFISERVVPGNETLTIWLIPKIAFFEKDEYGNKAFELDSYVLLADTKTGKIVSKYYKPTNWSSDAYELMSVVIDTLGYELNSDKITFGINSYSRASTRVCPTGDGFIELFAQEGDSLHCIFSYSIYDYHGENDGGLNGNSWMGEYRTSLIPLKDKADGFCNFALLTNYHSESMENNEVVSSDISSDSLRFYTYRANSYKEDKNHTKVFCKPLEHGKKDCNYYNKTLAETYRIIYYENKDNLQHYMCPKLPLVDSVYTMKCSERNEDISIFYNYLDDNHLSVSFETNSGAEYYIFEEKNNYTNFKYDYHD